MSVATIKVKGIPIEVEFNYSYDPGVHTYSNGDPGYPPSEELDIISAYIGGVEINNLLDYTEFEEDLFEELGNYIDKIGYEKYQD